MRAVIYCRVSTRGQLENRSLPTQRRACEQYCSSRGWTVDRVFMEEGESAKTADRAELQKLLAYCEENRKRIDHVLVHSISRLSRDVGDHHTIRAVLRRWGIQLHSATEPIDDTPEGRFMDNVLASVSQYDNDVRARRTREGMRAAVREGRWPFPPPIGYRPGPRKEGPALVHDAERAPFIRDGFNLLATGRYSARDVLKKLTERGLRTRRGKPVSMQTWTSAIRNPAVPSAPTSRRTRTILPPRPLPTLGHPMPSGTSVSGPIRYSLFIFSIAGPPCPVTITLAAGTATHV